MYFNFVSFFLLFYGMSLLVPPGWSTKKIEVEGVRINWQYKKDRIHFQLEAPTKGWVALGFNKEEKLGNSNLIMGCVEGGVVRIEDQYILGPGNHQAVEIIGGKNVLDHTAGKEVGHKTFLSFSMPIDYVDTYHHALKPGKTIYLWVAYATHDDFGHHSVMRKGLHIHL